MRHWLASILTYAIAALLVAGATLFAWMRSAQLTLTDETTVVARFQPAVAHEFEWEALGAGSYRRNCANCHGTHGQGRNDYPPLGHVWTMVLTPEGRQHVVNVHLYGLASRVRPVPMPPMGHIPDVELAAVMNHLVWRLASEPPPEVVEVFFPDEIRAQRGQRLSPRDVAARR